MKNEIVLGPLLGIESDTCFTVCILIRDLPNLGHPLLLLNHQSQKFKHQMLNSEKDNNSDFIPLSNGKDHFRYYRFELNLINESQNKIIYTYSIQIDGINIKNSNSDSDWSFTVVPQNYTPQVAYVSCNGRHDILTEDIPAKDYLGWQHLLGLNPDLLILTGDQVYTDKMIESSTEIISYIEGNIEFLDKFITDALDQLFLDLYIKSWSNKYITKALATIPNVMTWDDHDIIDGYGSYFRPYWKKLDFVYKAARKYYELFQIRTKANRSIIENQIEDGYNLCLKYCRSIYIFPDTRTNRNIYQILSDRQYKLLYEKISKVNQEEARTINFILPVPIAHYDFTNIIETDLDKIILFFKKKVKKIGIFDFSVDDAMDHWDHLYHKPEQLNMLDLLFKYGDILNPNNLIIISGDVHSSGAAKIIRYDQFNNKRYATQLISSPMVNKPSHIMKKLNNYSIVSTAVKVVNNYLCELLDFGASNIKNIYYRNFMIVKADEENRSVLTAFLYYESHKGWTNIYNNLPLKRTINSFEKDDSYDSNS